MLCMVCCHSGVSLECVHVAGETLTFYCRRLEPSAKLSNICIHDNKLFYFKGEFSLELLFGDSRSPSLLFAKFMCSANSAGHG